MPQPLCFTCRIRDQIVRLGEGRATVSGPHEVADPGCDLHAAEVHLAGHASGLRHSQLTAAAVR